MKKKLILAASVLFLIAAILFIPIFSVSAAVYVQDGNFTYMINMDGTALWAGYISDTVDDVVVPQYYDSYKITGVKNFGLENNSKIKSVDFMSAPELNSIGNYAFSGCSSIESIIVPNSITDIGDSVFRNCKALKYAEFYGNENSVPVEAFYGCSSLESIRLSARLQSIQSAAFKGCSSLQYVELYDTVTYIASNAFDDADNVILGVFKGTYAHQYAKDKNLRYILIDGPKSGDANGDGMVDILDSTEIQKFAAEKVDFTEEQFELADINNDGFVDVIDALLVQKYVVGAYDIPPIIYNS